jgi:ATP-dependent Clp protease ATP-binding subunit ClpA
LSYSILSSSLQGLILSNALRAQKNAEDESCTIALNNLRSEVIELRNEGLEKDKIFDFISWETKANYHAQIEAQKTEIEDLRRQLAEANEKCALAQANQEISEYWKNMLEKNVEELRESKEKCFEKSLDCVKKLKTSFSKVGTYFSKENFIRGDPEGVVEWISGEAEAFKEILSDRGDICAFFSAWVSHPVLEGKPNANHVRARISYSRTQQLHNMDIITQCSK